jgi:heptose-I-phosphate ethanolaminephosphotransferase
MEALRKNTERIPPIENLVDQRAGQPGTIVLLIGESTTRQHMSLYGYGRPTTPKLEALRDQLTIFDQVYAARPYTIEALQQILTFADQQNPDLYLTRPSLMSIMKQAGYRTYWITNQQTLTKRNTMLTNFSEQMDEQVYLNHQRSQNSYSFDSNVLEPLQNILKDGAERRFIVVHLLGTHMRYKYRFPPEFAVFRDGSGLPEWASGERAEMIDEYDNAVRYNDHVVSSVIGSLAAADKASLLVYFSDHGEDVYDTPPHDFIGRNEAKPTPPMYTVPFFLWTSPQWRAATPVDLAAARSRPYQLSHFIHTWADLTGLRFAGYEPDKSLINPAFREREILVGNPADQKSLLDLRQLLKPPAATRP